MNNTNKELQNIANNIVSKTNLQTSKKHGDIILAITIITIIISLIKQMRSCYVLSNVRRLRAENKRDWYHQKIKELSEQGGIRTESKINRQINRYLKKKDYGQYHAGLCKEILEAGKNVTPEQVELLLEEARV